MASVSDIQLEENEGGFTLPLSFTPIAERFIEIADKGLKLRQEASDKDLTEFTE